MTEKTKKTVLFSFIAVLMLAFLCSCGGDGRIYPESIEELDGLRAGAVIGTIHDKVIEENFPNSSINYLNTYADQLAAVENNKIDYFLIDKYKACHMLGQTDSIKLLDEGVYDQNFGFIFRKDSEESDLIREKMNDFISKSKKDGTIKKLSDKWFDQSGKSVEDAKPLNIRLTGENGTLTMAVSATSPPFTFVSNEQLNGFDIELAMLFCKEYGYDLTFSASNFDGIIPAVESGKADFGGASITITEERAKSVNFSDSYVKSSVVPVVPVKAESGLSIAKTRKSFDRTFLKENRWKMVLSGIGVTLEIAFSAAIFGSILGFLIYLLCRRENRLINSFFDGFAWLFSGLPMVVVLMILYYIIFGNTSLSGTIVSSIAFSISTGLSVYSLLKTSVKSIDRGQTEGAYSLGFNDRQTFFHIILPQAMTQFIPNYKGTLISMLKGTAIVGYIAVADLTKTTDVIRARTYEAFFPLISTAVIYLILVCLITVIIKKAAAGFEPRRRSESKILKKFGK